MAKSQSAKTGVVGRDDHENIEQNHALNKSTAHLKHDLNDSLSDGLNSGHLGTGEVSSAVLNPTDIRFYQLIWRPAQIMHKAWWDTLALQEWQPIYETTPRCRRWINQAIATRRGFPRHGTPYTLTLLERQLLEISEKLPLLLLALGLLRLGKPEYWMLKPYRTALQETLDSVTCTQIGVFAAASAPTGFHVRAPFLEAAQVTAEAQRHGMAILNAALPDSVALRASEILLAPQSHEEQRLEESVSSFGLKLLFRLARFL